MRGDYTQYSFNVYKLLRICWLGWVVTYQFTTDPAYDHGEGDNCVIKISYCVFGFRRSRVDAKLKKWAEKNGLDLNKAVNI